MTNQDFNIFLEMILERIKKTLGKKGEEYGIPSSRFSNFEDIAEVTKLPLEEGAFILMLKHFTIITDICMKRYPANKITKDLITEKFGDCINYLILIEGILKEKLKE